MYTSKLNMSAAGSSGEEMREEDLKKLTKNFRWLHRYNYGVTTHTETILLLIKKKKKVFLLFISHNF